MSLVLLAIAAGSVGYVVGKVWAIVIPLAVGIVTAVVVAAAGGSLADTPVPFTTVVATIGAAFGLLIRRQRASVSRA